MPLGDKIRQLDEKAAIAVRRAVDDLREEMGKRFEEAAAEMRRHLGEAAPELPASFFSEEEVRRIAEEEMAPDSQALDRARHDGRRGAFAGLLAAYSELDRAGSQSEILDALLAASERFAPRAALLLVRGEALAGWATRGFDAGPEAVRSVSLATGEEPWSDLVSGGGSRRLSAGRCGSLVSQLDSALPADGGVVPLVLRDQVAALLYADRAREDEPLELAALQCLTYAAAFALETLAFRQRATTATLEPVADAGDGGDDLGEGGALDETTELVYTTPTDDAGAPAVGWGRDEPEEVELDLEAEEAADLTVEEPPATSTPPHGDELLEPVEMEDEELAVVDDSSLEGAPTLGEPSAPVDAGIPWQTDEDEAGEEAAPDRPDQDEDEDDTFQRPSPVGFQPAADIAARPTEPGAPEPPGPAPADEAPAAPTEALPASPAPTFGGQVEPPEDIDGPGWAFSATRAPVPDSQEAAHGEARRLARLLVSEIQLYNQEEVEEGRRRRDVYERLKDDIDRSRKLYEERVDPEVRESTDYFYQELVRQLAAGDARALGI